jgi:tRNA (guanine-N7-)-methyltransferase
MPREVFESILAARRAELRSDLAEILPPGGTPLILEIGCGHGHFLTAYASAHTDQLCLGIDLRMERTDKARRKRDRANLSNLYFLRCDACNLLAELPSGVTLTDTYILFPDPWPKKRHHKNRLIQPEFLNELGGRSGQGSRFFFRTDYKPYFDEAREIIASHPLWRLLPDDGFPFEHVTIFQARAPEYHSLACMFHGATQAPFQRSTKP